MRHTSSSSANLIRKQIQKHQGTLDKNHHQSDEPEGPHIDREYDKRIGQYWSLNQDDAPSVTQWNEIWIWGGNNDGRGISEEIHLTRRRMDAHGSHQAGNI